MDHTNAVEATARMMQLKRILIDDFVLFFFF